MDGWDGGIQEEPARSPVNSLGRSGGLLRSPSNNSDKHKSKKKSVRFNNAVTVKVVPRVINTTPPKRSCISGTLLDPSTRTFRYLLLFLLCAQTFGANFSRYSPLTLQKQLMTKCHINSDTTFALMIGLSEIPSLLLVFICGYLIDRYFTVGKWAIGFSVGTVLGQAIFATGAFVESSVILIGGRILFQASAGGLYVTQNLSMARWLLGVEMGLAVGIALSANALTSYFSKWMLPIAADDYEVGPALLMCALMGLGSLSVTVLASALDAWGNDQLPKPAKPIYYDSPPSSPCLSSFSPSSSSVSPSLSPSSSSPSISSIPSSYLDDSSSPPVSIPPSPSSLSINSSTPSASPSFHTVITTRVMTATMTASSSSQDITSSSSSLLPSTSSSSLTTPIIGSSPTTSVNSTSKNTEENNNKEYLSPSTKSSIINIYDDDNNAILSGSPVSQPTPPQELPKIGNTPIKSSPARIIAGASLQITTKAMASSDDVAPGVTSVTTTAYRGRSTNSSYGTTTTQTTPGDPESATYYNFKQINEEGGHITLLILLSVTSVLLFVGGVFSHGLDKLDAILNFAAASGPVVGWLVDRLGRPSIFLSFGAGLQVATIVATTIVYYAFNYDNVASEVMGILLGVAWSFVLCGSYTGVALLAPGGWGGTAFAFVTGICSSAVTIAPILHEVPNSWIYALVSSVLGAVCVVALYFRKSVLNLNAHDIRRIVGYNVDEERAPLLL